VRRPDLPTLRGAWWTLRALRHVRRRLRRLGIAGAACTVPPPPAAAQRGVHGMLRRWPASCLERALVLQRWEAAHGRPRAVVIGVQGARQDLRAHAWLEGSADGLAPAFRELMRVPPDQGRPEPGRPRAARAEPPPREGG
jgi:hypothetical protein